MKNMSTYFVSDLECARGCGCPARGGQSDVIVKLWQVCSLRSIVMLHRGCVHDLHHDEPRELVDTHVCNPAGLGSARHSHLPSSTASQGINRTEALQVFSLNGSIITLEQISFFFPTLICLFFGFMCCVHTWACRGQRTNHGN